MNVFSALLEAVLRLLIRRHRVQHVVYSAGPTTREARLAANWEIYLEVRSEIEERAARRAREASPDGHLGGQQPRAVKRHNGIGEFRQTVQRGMSGAVTSSGVYPSVDWADCLAALSSTPPCNAPFHLNPTRKVIAGGSKRYTNLGQVFASLVALATAVLACTTAVGTITFLLFLMVAGAWSLPRRRTDSSTRHRPIRA
ncbi:hypothetical protein OG883_25530 [Streptomyces sp. NBC_01142]|uniref:hypothetical protein n=1 Tax=Streptomyces sp. NBC_01142 TaxID=2975865 RepID=UPI002258196C|nr:hypothetical protein [Streptomyces sp. NBC_01142]MCX4823189.1 hypothetical protein [Streptomyces sp. NBC_01142]